MVRGAGPRPGKRVSEQVFWDVCGVLYPNTEVEKGKLVDWEFVCLPCESRTREGGGDEGRRWRRACPAPCPPSSFHDSLSFLENIICE